MRKPLRLITIIITIVFLIVVFAMLFCFYMERKFAKNSVPEDLSASDTVEQYFRYLNDGNNYGIKEICFDDSLIYDKDDRDFVPLVYFLSDIKVTGCEEMSAKARNYDNYYDNAIVQADFDYHGRFGFDVDKYSEKNTDWTFYLAKESAGSKWKILSFEN